MWNANLRAQDPVIRNVLDILICPRSVIGTCEIKSVKRRRFESMTLHFSRSSRMGRMILISGQYSKISRLLDL